VLGLCGKRAITPGTRLAQAIVEALAILGALAYLRKDRLVDCEPRVDAQRCGGLFPRLVELTQLGVGGGQIATAVTMIRCARHGGLQLHQSFRIAPEQVVGKPQQTGNARRIERIKPHLRLERLDCPGRFSGNQQCPCKVMVGEIWIELGRALERGNGCVVLPRETQRPAERDVRIGQTGGQPHRLAS